MNKEQDTTPPQITCEDLLFAGQDDDISDLFQIALDVIETRGSCTLEDVKKWLPSYTSHKDLKATLHPELFNAVIIHALQK